MKTSELIKLLQKADPEGSAEVCVEASNVCSAAIVSVINIPANHDGPINIVHTNEKGYIVGGSYVNQGRKVILYSSTISSLIDHGNITKDKVDYSGAGGIRSYLETYHSYLEQQNKDIEYSIVKEHLIKWVVNKMNLEGLNPKEIIHIEDEVECFLKDNPKYLEGNNAHRQKIWDNELTVNKIGGIIKKGEAGENNDK